MGRLFFFICFAKKKKKKKEKTMSAAAGMPRGEQTVNVANPSCLVCKKTAYAMERKEVNDQTFHTRCFKCFYCKCQLNAGNFTLIYNKPYCMDHYKQSMKRNSGALGFRNDL